MAGIKEEYWWWKKPRKKNHKFHLNPRVTSIESGKLSKRKRGENPTNAPHRLARFNGWRKQYTRFFCRDYFSFTEMTLKTKVRIYINICIHGMKQNPAFLKKACSQKFPSSVNTDLVYHYAVNNELPLYSNGARD